jgi:hypothetical protein
VRFFLLKSLADQTAKASAEVAEQNAQSNRPPPMRRTRSNRPISSSGKLVVAIIDIIDQNSELASIMGGVSRTSGEARCGAETISKVAGVTVDARTTTSDARISRIPSPPRQETWKQAGASIPDCHAGGLVLHSRGNEFS